MGANWFPGHGYGLPARGDFPGVLVSHSRVEKLVVIANHSDPILIRGILEAFSPVTTNDKTTAFTVVYVAHPAGFEPATDGLEGRCSSS